MAIAGYGGSMKIATVSQTVEEWTFDGERREIDSTPLVAEHYAAVSGRAKHAGSCVVQFDAASAARIVAYFHGATLTRAAVAMELLIGATEKYAFNAILTRYSHIQSKDDLVRYNIGFTAVDAPVKS